MAEANDKICINICSYDDLLGLPSVGKAIASRVWDTRRSMDITPEILAAIPHVKMEKISHLIDFTSAQELADSMVEDEEIEDMDNPDITAVEFQDTMGAHGGDKIQEQVQDPGDQILLGNPIVDSETQRKMTEFESKTDNGAAVKQEPLISPQIYSDVKRKKIRAHFDHEPSVDYGKETTQIQDLKENIVKQDIIREQYQPHFDGRGMMSSQTSTSLQSKIFNPIYSSTRTSTSVPDPNYSSTPLSQRAKLPPTLDSYLPRPKSVHFRESVQQFISPQNNTNSPVLQQRSPIGNPNIQQHFASAPAPHYAIPQTGYGQPTMPVHVDQQRPYPTASSPQLGPQPQPTGLNPVIVGTQHQTSTQPKSRSQPTMLKSLKFDGTDKCEDWSAFLVKFDIFADASRWSEAEKRDQLCWCLTGAASRYGTNLIRHNRQISYTELVEKMEQRFNHGNETETLQVQFHNARQSPRESTDEWADRLSILADKAFRDVPEKYVQSQIITKFLQALNDKEAGKAASRRGLSTSKTESTSRRIDIWSKTKRATAI